MYQYTHSVRPEPDWRRFPGWAAVSAGEWADVQWQRAHCVKSVRQLAQVCGGLLDDGFYADLQRDREEAATMSLLLPPQVLNSMVPDEPPSAKAMLADPVRRYMLPVFSDRDPDWPSHPHASRDSLHEAEMWAVEGLTHRYPTKVLAEIVSTCPQYCGHCTRMDLVGPSTPQVAKYRFAQRGEDRLDRMLAYLAATPSVRDVVVSGGDVANVPWPRLEAFLRRLLEIESVRDIRLATKALVALPQHWLAERVLDGIARIAATARSRGVGLAVHTHANAAQQVTPLVSGAARALLDRGVRDVRNQGVLMRGVNDSAAAVLDLCFALLDNAGITPYYFYLCDMIPHAEHWRVPLHTAQRIQDGIMGFLPGFATPRLVCDVPYVGKRWVHQAASYDRMRGVSRWTSEYRAQVLTVDESGPTAGTYYDPIDSLPPEGRLWWSRQRDELAAAR
ncbi:lysine 2,3-aminomutase [Amycolatopsis sp. DG1A-15b]|uniref:KamA family radical SAM protein n=1 Tax=Amycolatopsis sp. DG1A-15b TaxID=3052846 RepID=UPI00255BE69F|nr:lysine 2,3-aminomutase [Amycolatopsis sp. DG1A-15b]WIX91435.1 lysine 2,3-aminomutase [Amycolatopsis sp. DG1A-15b]